MTVPAFTQGQTWRQDVKYTIEAELDTTTERLNAWMEIRYVNNSPDTLARIFLQVPSNAFHDEENSAVREMNRFSRGALDVSQRKAKKLTIQGLQFLRVGSRSDFPLRAYDFSDTILDLPVPFELLPGDTLTLGVSFFQDQADNRSKRRNRPYEFNMWFPKVCVYDSTGWHAEPFHFMMESYDVFSAFAQMSIILKVPGNHIVVGAGNIVEGDPGWNTVRVDTSLTKEDFQVWHDSVRSELRSGGLQDGPREVKFQVPMQHDFIWTSSPNFVYFEQPGAPNLNLFYSRYSQKRWLTELLETSPAVFSFLEEYFGPIPSGTLNLVRARGNIMTRPGLAIVSGEEYFELTYELAGIYLPGTVATNGVTETWIARGMQVYLGKAMSERVYGPKGYDIGDAQEDMNWLERQYPLPTIDGLLRNLAHIYSQSGQNEAISKPIYGYKDPISAMANVYLKSELFFEMLEYVVGDSVFKASFRRLMDEHGYDHIGERQIQRTFEQVSGEPLDWFFEQWLNGTPTIDYIKEKVRQRRGDDGSWVTEVDLKRKGDGVMPVDVELELDDGQVVTKRWSGKEETGKVTFKTERKPRHVRVDPDDLILDANRLNNEKPRIEFRPDLPLLKFIHMPNDAILVLLRPLIDRNGHDSVRLGFRARSSYRAFFRNLTLEAMIGLGSGEFDALISYSNPLSPKSLLNRYRVMARKNEGRFEADAGLQFSGSKGILTSSGRQLKFGLNYSALLNKVYTFRKAANDSGQIDFDEWEDTSILAIYLQGELMQELGTFNTGGRLRFESALPGGDAKFTKLSGRLRLQTSVLGFRPRIRGNAATSFGPDRLPLQDQFRAEGAGARERFQNNIVKTGDGALALRRRYVAGGGYLRGYAGQPLAAERYLTVNLELETEKSLFLGIRPLGFFDSGRIWPTRTAGSVIRSDAGFGFSWLGQELNLFGGNLALFSSLSAKLLFPIWISDPPPGERRRQMRWYFTLGKAL